MPSTFHLDLVNGNDANDGSNWANAWLTFATGATAARIAPGDTIKVAKSSDPTSLGSGKWTAETTKKSALPATVSITSSAGAAGAVITITKNGHGFVNGDIIYVAGHTDVNAIGYWEVANKTDNTLELKNSYATGAGGTSGTMQKMTSRGVILSTPCTKVVTRSQSNWTAGTNVTSANAATGGKTGRYISIITAAGHAGAGIIAKFGLPASLDLSGYQQLSFWLQTVTTVLAADDLRVKLYSDAACTNEVESFSIPATGSNSTGYWIPIVFNKGSALSSTVQGIAIYATKALASKTYYISAFVASKAVSSDDSLTFRSLISKQSAAGAISEEPWVAVAFINEDLIIFDAGNGAGVPGVTTPHRGYYGASETVTTYKREAIPPSVLFGWTEKHCEVKDSGSDGSLITFQGGWDTSANTRNGFTIIDGVNRLAYGLYVSSINFIKLDYFGFVRYDTGLYVLNTCSDLAFDNILCAVCCNNGIYVNSASGVRYTFGTVGHICDNQNTNFNLYTANYFSIDDIYSISASANGSGLTTTNTVRGGIIKRIRKANGNASNGISMTSLKNLYIDSIDEANYNASAAMYAQKGWIGSFTAKHNTYGLYDNGDGSAVEPLVIGKLITDNNDYAFFATGKTFLQCYDFSYGEAGSAIVNWGNTATNDAAALFQKYGSGGLPMQYHSDGGIIELQTTTKYDTSTHAWKFTVPTARRITFPLRLKIAKILCAANKLVTVKAWMKKDHATNGGCSILALANQIAGLTATQEAVAANNTDWQQLTITFTPTEVGVVEIEARAWYAASATSYAYVDTLEITQAD